MQQLYTDSECSEDAGESTAKRMTGELRSPDQFLFAVTTHSVYMHESRPNSIIKRGSHSSTERHEYTKCEEDNGSFSYSVIKVV